MYKIDYGKRISKKYGIGSLIFLIILLAGYGVYDYINHENYKNSFNGTTEGSLFETNEIISNGEKKYYSSYSYVVDGDEYICYNSNSYKPEEKMDIYYQTNNIKNCLFDKNIVNIITYVIVAFIFLLSFLLVIVCRDYTKVNLKLFNLSNGILYKNVPYVVVTNQKLNDTLYVVSLLASDSPVRRATDETIYVVIKLPSGEEVKYKTRILRSKIKKDITGTIDILVDKNDYNNYYIDFNIEKLD